MFAFFVGRKHNCVMRSDWRKRLEAAIQAKLDAGEQMIPLAGKFGLTRNYIEQFMKGKPATPGVTQFVKLCDAAGVSPTDILYGKPITEADRELLELLESVPAEDVRNLIALARRLARGEA